MTDINEAFRAGIDAIVADNALTGNAFNDALRTVLTDNFSNTEAGDWRDAIAAVYESVGLINNATYNNLRGSIINAASADEAEALFVALGASISQLPETAPAVAAARLVDLRDERDSVQGSLDRLDVLIAAEPPGTVGRLVKAIFRNGKDLLRVEQASIREQIKIITGDPDS